MQWLTSPGTGGSLGRNMQSLKRWVNHPIPTDNFRESPKFMTHLTIKGEGPFVYSHRAPFRRARNLPGILQPPLLELGGLFDLAQRASV